MNQQDALFSIDLFQW